LVGSAAGTTTTSLFLYVIFRFPILMKVVKADGADLDVVARLTTSYHLNVRNSRPSAIMGSQQSSQLVRVVFRFLFTIPFLILGVDAVRVRHIVVNNECVSPGFSALTSDCHG
jgi:hypothetical protein